LHTIDCKRFLYGLYFLRFDSRYGHENSFFYKSVMTVSGAHLPSYSMATGVFFSEVRWPGLEPEHSPPSDAEVKKAWS
jgi:hypothetical protein